MIGRLVATAVVVFSLALTARGATITGRVDGENRGPLPSMVVAAYAANGSLQSTATTDSAGHYALTVPPGTYRLLAYDNAGVFATSFMGDADSFESTPQTIVAGDISNVNFLLRLGGYVSGTISPATGSAEKLTVAAYNLNGTRRGFTLTSASGAFNLVLPPGNYKIVAFDDAGNLAPKFYPNETTFNAATPVRIEAGQNITMALHLDVASHLTGTVVDAATNLPLAEITMIAYDSSGNAISTASSNVAGAFDVHVPAGQFKLVAADSRRVYATAYYSGNTFIDATLIDIGTGQTRANLRIPMQRGGMVTGRITDTSGAPLSVTVAAYDRVGLLQGKTQTDASGNYALVLPPGEYRIAAYDDALTFATRFYPSQNVFRFGSPVLVIAGQTIGAINIALSRGARINGSVVDAATNIPVGGITVAAYDMNGDFVTDAVTSGNGQYALLVPAGSYRLLAYDNQLRYATAYAGSSSYELSSVFIEQVGSSDRADFRITRGVRVSGTIRDAAGRDLTGIVVTALDDAGNRRGNAVSKSGAFDLVLLPDRYRLLASDPHAQYAAAYAPQPVVVTAGAPPPPVTFVLSPLARRHAAPH